MWFIKPGGCSDSVPANPTPGSPVPSADSSPDGAGILASFLVLALLERPVFSPMIPCHDTILSGIPHWCSW